MTLLQRIHSLLTGPWVIRGAENRYFQPRAAHRPALVHKMYARKTLAGTWSLYDVTDHPMRPRGHFHERNMFGLLTGRVVTVDHRRGEPQKIAGGLTLRQAFDRVRAHEEQPRRVQMTSSSGRNLDLVLRQEPTNSPHYWRRMSL